jgi:succinate dehydrogenase / fumarate reductase membrane anchor subunit
MPNLRTPLRRALGTGSAHSGAGHWWAQRVTAGALVPLTGWFAVSLWLLPDLHYLTLRAWLAAPVSGFLAMLLVAVLAYHAQLGTSVIAEDYVHTPAARLSLLLGLRGVFLVAAGLAVFSILRIAFATPVS